MRGFSGFLQSLVWTLSTLYFVNVAGLNPLQLVLVGTVLEISVFLFEVPTGIVADLYSRKLSIVIGFVLIGLGFLVEGTLPYFATILLAQAMWGIGYTFTSGADSAWIADELGEEQAGAAFLRGAQWSRVGALLGIGVSVALGKVSLAFPIAAGGIIYLCLAAFLALSMPETGFRPTPKEDRSSWQAMGDTFKAGISAIKLRPALIILLTIGLFYGLASEGIDRLWQVHAMNVYPDNLAWGISMWFGIISAVTLVLSIAITQVLTKKVDLKSFNNVGSLLVWINAAFILSVAGFALSGNFTLAMALYLTLALLRRVNGPLHQAWMNRNIPSQVRATVLSMSGQVDSLGQTIGGPIIGLVAIQYSVSSAILLAAAILIPIPFLFARVKNHSTAPPVGGTAVT